MQSIHDQTQPRQHPPALRAIAHVAIHAPPPARPQLPIEVCRHAIRRPPVIPPEPQSGEDVVHSGYDPRAAKTVLPPCLMWRWAPGRPASSGGRPPQPHLLPIRRGGSATRNDASRSDGDSDTDSDSDGDTDSGSDQIAQERNRWPALSSKLVALTTTLRKSAAASWRSCAKWSCTPRRTTISCETALRSSRG